MKKRKLSCGILIFLLLLWGAMPLKAAETDEDSYLEEMKDSVDFSGLDDFLSGIQTPEESLTFSGLVEELLDEGISGFDAGVIIEWLKDVLLGQLQENRKLLIEVVLLAVGFSILKNFAGAFASSYISDLCFILVYCVLAVMLLQSFLAFGEIAGGVLSDSVDFMTALIPTFCITMVFSAGTRSAAGFYQTAFLVIYLVQWLFLNILVPMIHIYVLMELMNHFFEDEKFENLTELLKGMICWGMKIAGVAVLGLNVVQGLIAPAKDRLLHGGISRAASLIPGIGNTINGVSELLLGSGILIKNCVGAAALAILVVIALVPMLQVACMAFFYKVAAVLAEPVTDKRIAGCLRGMAAGGALYLKLMGYCIALFFLTIALCTAVSGFIY